MARSPAADEIERELNAARANSIATKKGAIGSTLTAFQKVKGKRQAAEILKPALEAITNKDFDTAQAFLQQNSGHQNTAVEQQRHS